MCRGESFQFVLCFFPVEKPTNLHYHCASLVLVVQEKRVKNHESFSET